MRFNPDAIVNSLYIHWPFCLYKCHFCPFVALAGHDEFMQRYHEALKKEIIQFSRSAGTKQSIQTIFFGGGTPSTYPPELLLDMFGTLYNEFFFQEVREITLEVNPGTVTQEKVQTWQKVGVNRLSLGVQSLNDGVLKKLNRHQTTQDVWDFFNKVEGKITNLSVDLILGLPGIDELEWKKMIETVVTWPIKHVSMYFLTVHEDTPLYFGVKQKKIALPPEDWVVDLYAWTVDAFKDNGLYQYEVSNFARPGFESLHNKVYWERKPYKGVGLGAASFDGSARLINDKNLMHYLQSIETDKDPIAQYESLTPDQEWLEKMMLGLRQSKGISYAQCSAGLRPELEKKLKDKIDLLKTLSYVNYEEERISLTTAGLAVVNEIIIQLSSL